MRSTSKHQTKILFVHPSSLGHHSAVFLRLEPLGLELISEACRKSGYSVRLVDLQACSQQDYFRLMEDWRPDAVGFSLNYLANIPEVIDLAKQTRKRWGTCFIFVGGHSASFPGRELLEHGAGSIDCVVRGAGEEATPKLAAMAMDDRRCIHTLTGIASADAAGASPEFSRPLYTLHPARHLLPD